MTKFHASVSCSNLPTSIAFYRALLGVDPAKVKVDYAKFELDVPPLTLSVISGTTTPGWNVNHLGLRVPDSAALLKIQERLEAAGFPCKREEGVECCYALQTKFWIADPDRTLWEVYVLEEDREEFGKDTVPTTAFARTVERPKATWSHRLGEPLPPRIPHDENSLHEVALEGTFNDDADSDPLVADAFRALRPGGELRLHGLAGDQPFHGKPALPGPAAEVKRVPVETEPLRAVIQAGFVDVRIQTLSPKAHFTVDGVSMREMLLVGRKPGHRPRAAAHVAVYLGPLAQVTDDYGNVYPRGSRVVVNIHDWQALQNGPVAPQFLLLPPKEARADCCAK